jgi:peptidoglycan/LPS O-acetylase OafA/YrhL
VLESYRRVTSSGNFIPEIDGLRFFAIASVFIFHLTGDILKHSPADAVPRLEAGLLFPLTQVLNMGVSLFFAISGFVLALQFAARVPLNKYFQRRLTRLEIPYLLSLVLFFALKVAAGKGNLAELLPHFLASVFYVHNLLFGVPSSINFVAWSLEVEVQFYLLAPVFGCLFAIKRRLIRRMILVGLILLATRLPASKLSLLGYCQYFLAGFLFAELYLSYRERWLRHWTWDVVTVAAGTALLAVSIRGGSIAAWSSPWLIGLLFAGSFRGVLTNRIVTQRWLTTIGGMCYSIYLLHNYLIAGVGMLTERWGADLALATRLFLQFLIIGIPVLLISALYFRFVERPCMRANWPRRLSTRIRIAAAPTPC